MRPTVSKCHSPVCPGAKRHDKQVPTPTIAVKINFTFQIAVARLELTDDVYVEAPSSESNFVILIYSVERVRQFEPLHVVQLGERLGV